MNKQSHMLNDTEREIKIKTTEIKPIVAHTKLFEKNHLNEAVSKHILVRSRSTFEIAKMEHNLVG